MDGGSFKDHVMTVANDPGEQLFPGELAKTLAILAAGREVNYVGASAVELIGPDESAGNCRQMAVEDDKLVTVRFQSGPARSGFMRSASRYCVHAPFACGSASSASTLCASVGDRRSSTNSPCPTIGHRGAPTASHLRVTRTW